MRSRSCNPFLCICVLSGRLERGGPFFQEAAGPDDDGRYIRKLRKPMMSLRTLSRIVEVSAVFPSDMEIARRNIPDAWLDKIVDALGETRKSLIEGIIREKIRKAEEGKPPISDLESGRPALVTWPECGKEYSNGW